ncbi:MAG: glucosamine-6-phosphate deaminase [Deltaproteobacteria bacterium]|nr:glucosamine-6-phosphate deaminase [Deltaproteobacteria bacterium]
MEVIVLEDAGAVAEMAATIVDRTVRGKANAVLGLPTGETPKRFYAALVARHRAGLDFRRVVTFNLDEYVGLPEDHPRSFHRYMREHFFDQVTVAAASLPDGNARDLDKECARYEAAVQKAIIDLCVLGVGEDGHIAFNEPASALSSRTRLKTLTSATLVRNGFDANGPRHAITMGIGTILDARRCLVLAQGEKKARAIAAMVEGPLTARVPASALQMHARTTVLIDREAAAELELVDYYREVFLHKPAWQKERDGTLEATP